jgi:glycosyltransferase involved in cell wall biosynthesis
MNEMQKVAVIGTVGLPGRYGGFETLVENLVGRLQDRFEFHVYCSGREYTDRQAEFNGAKLHYINLKANGPQSMLYDFISMLKAARFADCMLILGVSGCMFLPFIRLFYRRRLVLNIDGVEWRREKWGGAARWLLKRSEQIGVRIADQVISDNAVIQKYLANEYGANSTCIAYGGDHVLETGQRSRLKPQWDFLEEEFAFTVCRIEPENNIELILRAFVDEPVMSLVIVGNWAGSEYGKRLRGQFEAYSTIHLLDPIYNISDLNVLRSGCAIYVHGHSAGGTNPSLVEAMSLGLPVLAYDVAYNRESTQNKALYFRDSSSLAALLKSVKKSKLERIAANMEDIAAVNYTWQVVGEKYAEIL